MSTPVGPYSPVVRAGDLVFTAGQVGINDGALVEGGLDAVNTPGEEVATRGFFAFFLAYRRVSCGRSFGS